MSVYLAYVASLNGVNPTLVSYLVAIANGGGMVGRLLAGVTSDQFGPVNVLIISSFATGVLTYVWPYCTRTGPVIALAVLYG